MKVLVKGVRSVVGLCDLAAAELKTRDNIYNQSHSQRFRRTPIIDHEQLTDRGWNRVAVRRGDSPLY